MKSKICSLLALFCLSLSAKANNASIDLSGGDYSYRSVDLNTSVDVDATWAFLARFSSYSSSLTDSTTLGSLGASVEIDDSLAAHFRLQGRREPNSVRAFGLAFGLNWAVSDLWDADPQTLLFLDGEFMGYRQAGAQTRFQRLGHRETQRAITLGVSQEIGALLALSASYTRYGYSTAAENFSGAVDDRFSRFSSIQGLIPGFPRDAFTLELQWFISDEWTATAAASITRIASQEERTRSLALGASYQFDPDWKASVEVTGSRTGDTRNPSSATLGVGYFW